MAENLRQTTMARNFHSSRQFDSDPNVHMFTQDITLGVMPIGGKSSKHKSYAVKIEGDKSETDKAWSIIQQIGGQNRHGLEGSLSDAVEEIAQRLSWEGSAAYELIDSDIDVPYISGFTTKNLFKLKGWYLQIIPKKEWKFWQKKFVIQPSKKIWLITMPSILGGSKTHLKTLKRLKLFNSLGPSFWREDMQNGVIDSNFDFNEFTLENDINRTRITKHWGWNRRDWSQKRSTEFYCFYKLVDYRWSQAVLREFIVKEINKFLKRKHERR